MQEIAATGRPRKHRGVFAARQACTLSGPLAGAALQRGMEKPSQKKGGKPASDSRDERLKAALKANMQKRKAQARARSTSESPQDKTDK
ncbi:hypothetical protein [Pseudoruegeria sp. SHC-113]|uniref:hypothetical protein n=1 Tax=Pseudoruegeria sp. SHC-113 TaxID=2855439 RepID=UPI0021BB9B9C|nr:hypothetical protein [Pseudoruegeria sp. SHC-113]MCT8161699.1 hypothetical protein [Pseudoruegeria sp. SHC-113]